MIRFLLVSVVFVLTVDFKSQVEGAFALYQDCKILQVKKDYQIRHMPPYNVALFYVDDRLSLQIEMRKEGRVTAMYENAGINSDGHVVWRKVFSPVFIETNENATLSAGVKRDAEFLKEFLTDLQYVKRDVSYGYLYIKAGKGSYLVCEENVEKLKNPEFRKV